MLENASDNPRNHLAKMKTPKTDHQAWEAPDSLALFDIGIALLEQKR